MIVAHGGDTLSPSVMSGLDRGAHIIALTNMIAPDIFVPGNHEFDFGKAVFLERMGEATFPLYAANLRDADGAPLPALQGPRDPRLRRRAHRADRPRLRAVAAHVVAGGPAFRLDASTPRRQQAAALRAEGADFVVRGAALQSRRRDQAAIRRAPPTCCSPATPTTCSSISTSACAMVEFELRRALRDLSSTSRSRCARSNGKRTATWWPQFRVIDTATVTPDPEVAAAVARFEQALLDKMTEPIATTAVALESSTATVRTREAAIGNLFADAMRVTARTPTPR